jgi:hypothetical protein
MFVTGGRRSEKGSRRKNGKTTLPPILRPYLTIDKEIFYATINTGLP